MNNKNFIFFIIISCKLQASDNYKLPKCYLKCQNQHKSIEHKIQGVPKVNNDFNLQPRMTTQELNVYVSKLSRFQESLSKASLEANSDVAETVRYKLKFDESQQRFITFCSKVPYFQRLLFIEKKPFYWEESQEDFIYYCAQSPCLKKESVPEFVQFLCKVLLIFEIHEISHQTWVKRHIDAINNAYVSFEHNAELRELKKPNEAEIAEKNLICTINHTTMRFKYLMEMLFGNNTFW